MRFQANCSEDDVLLKIPKLLSSERDSKLQMWRWVDASWEATAASTVTTLQQCYMLVKAWRQIRRDVSYTAFPHCMGMCAVIIWVSGAGTKACANVTQCPTTPGLEGLQPVGMLVTNSSMSGSSYRSGITFSGQGRLKDILVWNKAQGMVNWS